MSILSVLDGPAVELLYCSPGDELMDVVRDMVENGVNAIAVLDGEDDLIGILTEYDIMQALSFNRGDLKGVEVHEWMTANVITCDIDTSLNSALSLMGKHGIRHLVITDCEVAVAILGIRQVLADIHARDELEIRVLRDIAVAARASLAA